MFVISKLIGFLFLPSNLVGFLAGAGVVALLFRKPRWGQAALVVAALLLVAGGWSPLGRLALAALEDRFPPPQLAGPITGIVMLGGAVDTHITAARGQATLNEAAERITATGELGFRYPQARLLLSGGGGDLSETEVVTESAVARDVLVGLGVTPERIEVEERSRTTCENAEQSLRVAQPAPGDRWLLVTSASHMPRAVACFRAVGFAVIPYPVDYRTRGSDELSRPFTSIGDGFAALDLAAHEWIGLAIYRLRGQTDTVLPAPQE